MKHSTNPSLLIIGLSLAVMLGCQSPGKSSEDFDILLEAYYQDHLELYMLYATYLGDYRYNDSLPNYLSKSFKDKERKFYRDYNKRLNRFSEENLSPEQILSQQILQWEIDIQTESFEFEKDLMPIDQMWSLNLDIGQLGSGGGAQPFNTLEDYRNWLSRLDDFKEWLLSAKAKMKEGIEKGIVLPKPLIQKVLPQLESVAVNDLSKNIFWGPLNEQPETIEDRDWHDLGYEYAILIVDELNPIIRDLHEFMSTEYLEAGRETSGYGDLPGMEGYYDHAIKYYTTTTMSADEIHELGIQEVSRIQNEMKKVMEEVGFEGTLHEFFEHVKTNPDLMPFDDPQQVIDHFNDIHQKVMPHVENLFDNKPKSPFEVRRVEAFREKSASAHYIIGTPDGSRPGVFYVPIPDVTSYHVFSDESLFLHEAIPGHHFQLSLQQENPELPSFRKNITWYSVYGEGWALYTESLGKELGLYTDPYQYFGMLSAEIHRAIRLVVDTGLHAKGWSREKAIQYSMQNQAESEDFITSEIERYMANPGQALSYKIGQLKIQELRDHAQEILGFHFDIREFHNKILESGNMPLALLEEKINAWIHQVE